MSDIKISQLPAGLVPTGVEFIPAVQAGATVRLTAAQLVTPVDRFIDVTDHTSINAAYAAAAAAGKWLLVPGPITTSSSWTPNPAVPMVGIPGVSSITWTGSGIMSTLGPSQNRCRFEGMKFALPDSNPTGTLFKFSNTFLSSFRGCEFWGTNDVGNIRANQTGVELRDNAGGNTFRGCLFANFGYAVKTSTQMNRLVDTDISGCHVGILGEAPGGNYVSAMDLNSTHVVGHKGQSLAAITIDGPANLWLINHIWIEGIEGTAITVGNATGGPFLFRCVGGQVAADTRCIDIRAAQEWHLGSLYLRGDDNELTGDQLVRVHSVDAIHGTYQGMNAAAAFDVAFTNFANRNYVADRAGVLRAGPAWTHALDPLAPHGRVGTWVTVPAPGAGRAKNQETENTSVATGDEIWWQEALPEGHHRVFLSVFKFTDSPVYEILVDGTSIATFDGYDATGVAVTPEYDFSVGPFLDTTTTPKTVAQTVDRSHRITVRVAGAGNAGAGGKRARINWCQLNRVP